MNPFTGFGCLDLVSDGQWRKTGTASYTDYISWVKGAHTLKFGFDFRNIGEQGPNSFYSRRQVSTSAFTNTGTSLLQGVSGASDQLEDAVSALYGFVWSDFGGEFFNKNGARQGTDNKRFRQHEYDWYVQDSWKVRPNLTFNYGLRYQLDGVPYEENANFSNLLTNPASFPVVFSVVGPGTGLSGRADLVGNPYAPGTNPNAASGKVYFTNLDAFSQRFDSFLGPIFTGPGSVGRNHFYGPGLVDFDLAFSKKTKITERFGLELRIEGYNIFNHPHFTNPGADSGRLGNQLDSPLFGIITSTASRADATTSARQMQVAMKLSF